MKYFYPILILILLAIPSFSQEFIKHATVHFKDATVAKGDFYYYPTMAQSATVVDSLDKKQVYDLASIEYVEGKGDLYRVINYNGSVHIFEAVVEGTEASLYKTNYREDTQFFVLKEDKLYWLEGKDIIFKKDKKTFRQNNYRYKGTLKFLFNDNRNVTEKIEELTYFESKLTPLIIAYNNGHITYLKSRETEKLNRISDWKVYAQYSNERYNTNMVLKSIKDFRLFQAGAEYFIWEESRHSFKIGFEYSQFETYKKKEGKFVNLNTRYYYDILKEHNGNVYLGVRLVDIGKRWGDDDERWYFYPNLSPLVGYEYHISKKIDLYAELNHMFNLTKMPMNFSFGLTYDL